MEQISEELRQGQCMQCYHRVFNHGPDGCECLVNDDTGMFPSMKKCGCPLPFFK